MENTVNEAANDQGVANDGAPLAGAPLVATGSPAGSVPAEAAPSGQPELLTLAIEALRAAYPQAVPELIGGATVAELRASLALAQRAYSRIREQVLAEQARPAVPTGFASHSQAVDLTTLDASTKIALGLQQRPPS